MNAVCKIDFYYPRHRSATKCWLPCRDGCPALIFAFMSQAGDWWCSLRLIWIFKHLMNGSTLSCFNMSENRIENLFAEPLQL